MANRASVTGLDLRWGKFPETLTSLREDLTRDKASVWARSGTANTAALRAQLSLASDWASVQFTHSPDSVGSLGAGELERRRCAGGPGSGFRPLSRFVGAANALCPNVYLLLPIDLFAAGRTYLDGSWRDPVTAPARIERMCRPNALGASLCLIFIICRTRFAKTAAHLTAESSGALLPHQAASVQAQVVFWIGCVRTLPAHTLGTKDYVSIFECDL